MFNIRVTVCFMLSVATPGLHSEEDGSEEENRGLKDGGEPR